MNVRELRRVLADLDDETVVWADLGDIGMAGVERVRLNPAGEDRGPVLLFGIGRVFGPIEIDEKTPKLL